MYRIDRNPSDELVELFLPGAPLRFLAEYALRARYPVDLDFWSDASGTQRASVYCGLTRILDVYVQGQRVRFEVRSGVVARVGRAPGMTGWLRAAEADELRDRLAPFLDLVIPEIATKRSAAGASMLAVPGRAVIARDFSGRFGSDGARQRVLLPALARIRAALADLGFLHDDPAPKLSTDAVLYDGGGFVLAEAESRRAAEIAATPAHAALCLTLWDLWTDTEPRAVERLGRMAAVRAAVGLIPPLTPPSTTAAWYGLTVESGVSEVLIDRMHLVAARLADAGLLDPARFTCEITTLSGDTTVARALAAEAPS